MATHPYLTEKCPEAKDAKIGPVLKAVTTFVGIVAPLNAVPQILKIYETQSAAGVSLLTYLIVIATQFVWLVYGWRLRLKPLIISSIVVLVLSGAVAAEVLIYG